MSAASQLAFFVYFIVIALISVIALRRTSGVEDYVIGGRNLPAPVAALSAGASDMSGWLLLGLPGAVYLGGLGESWIVVGLVIGAFLNWTLVAPRLRAFTESLDGALTLPQFFVRRVASVSKPRTLILNLVATTAVLVFFCVYTAAGFVAGAKLFVATLGLSYPIALWSGAAVIMVYTAIGGFLAVSWTDFVQALLMLAALVVVPMLALSHLPPESPLALDLPADTGAIAIASLLAWGLGYFGQPHILARFFAIKDVASVRRARRIGMTWMIASSAGAVAVGLIGAQYFAATPLADAETVFMALTEAVLNPWIAGLVIAAILAAVMSTVDSQLLVASTTLVEDCLGPWVGGLDEVSTVWVSRGMVLAIAFAAAGIATDPDSEVLGLVAYAWAGLGASFGPAVLFCLFSRATSSAGIIIGMLTGAGVTIVWRALDGGLFDLYELLPAFAAASIATWVGSRVLPDRDAAAVLDRLVVSTQRT